MNEQPFLRLEAHLERLIEGAFAHWFRKTVSPHDVALALAQALEQHADTALDGRRMAPDHFMIRLHPDAHDHLLRHLPDLDEQLSQHLIEFAQSAGYHLHRAPDVALLADTTLGLHELRVDAALRHTTQSVTAVMGTVDFGGNLPPPNAHLIVNGEWSFALTEPIINIGRSREAHLVLPDPFVSRTHAQLRLRFGHYTIFDTESQGGTFVNDVRVREYRLQPNDVVRLGRTQLVYVEDAPPEDPQTGVQNPLH